MSTLDWPPPRRPRRRGRLFLLGVLAAILFGGGTALSYYIEVLWFDSLGFGAVFWKTINIQSLTFSAFFAVTFAILYGSFLLLRPSQLAELTSPILINGQPLRLPVEPVLRLIGGGVAIAIAAISGFGMLAEWPALALWWYGRNLPAAAAISDPIFGRPIGFYLFSLPAWQLIIGWMTTLAVVIWVVSIFFAAVRGGARAMTRTAINRTIPLRGVSITSAAVLLAIAAQVYVGRFERLLTDHTIFAGVTYTDAHVAIPGMLLVMGALILGAAILAVNAVSAPKLGWIAASVAPATVVYLGVSIVGWYVNGFVVKPNELVRESPYIAHNIEMTRQAFALNRIQQIPFPADAGVAAVDVANNQETIQNIRLWDWRALQDTLRQIQEIRTYYDFPDIDIDRYSVNGTVRQMMLAVRELNIDRLPESSRNWINEKLIYTHGYGVTMNPVNGFTPEGLPDLLLGNMPVQSTVPDLKVTRPEVYFGELTTTDVYVKTRQKEFNYPQGETNNETSYEGNGGIHLGSIFRRLLIAIDRGDVTKMPFSDDINSESRLLMRRDIRDRVQALAPFLTFDPDPYIVVTAEGRLVWMMDGFTESESYPYARHYRLENQRINYVRNAVKATIDAYDGTVNFYVFDAEDPIVAAYRAIFPSLFKDASQMSADLRKHVRYPELMLDLQASVYGLYHMSSPDVFYNREDLWTIASEVGLSQQRDQATQTMEPNFVLMKLPGEKSTEFIEILPFTPANRNNLIGWIAGRSDDPNYGTALVYNFPKTRLVDGPLQIEARIDQNAQLSGQLSLWNQQGSHVRRGSLIVIPVGRALLYAEPIYLQAERSPMPELRIVVLALQDKLAYGPSFEAAMASLFNDQPSSLTPMTAQTPAPRATPSQTPSPATAPATMVDTNTLINDAARDLAEYQRLTAEGKLGEAGQRLEALKLKLERLASQKR